MRWFLGLLVLALTLPSIATAQNRPGNEQQRERVMATGTLKAIAPGRLHVVNDAGDQWLVAIDPRAEVVVTGMATPEFLRPGMLVKFTGKFNRKAEATEPLKKLIVYTPRQPAPMQRERGAAFDPAAAELAKGLFKTDEPMPERKPVKPMRPAKPAKPPEIMDVATSGAVVGLRSGKLQVRGAEGTFKFELTEDAELTLDINDYRLAQPGDKVDIEGWSYANDKSQVLANRVTIRLTETVGEAKKKDDKPVNPLEETPGEKKAE